MQLSLTLRDSESLPADVAAAHRLGFDAIQIQPRFPALRPTEGNFAQRIRSIVDGLPIAGLVRPLIWDGVRTRVDGWIIEEAAELGCRFVTPMCATHALGRTSSSAVAPFRDWALSLGELARSHGVRLLLRNAGLFATARQMWAILDQLPSDTFGCDWNLQLGTVAADAPAVAIPMLNLRLRSVEVDLSADERILIQTVHRLAGIGFQGSLNVSVPTPLIIEAGLSERIERLRSWMGASAATSAQKKAPVGRTGASAVV